jgi:hypothetical protein
MHWLYLLLAIGLLGVALRTSSLALLVVCLLGSLGLFLAWIVGWYAARVGDSSRDESQMIDPTELRRLRQLAEARKAGQDRSPMEPPAA